MRLTLIILTLASLTSCSDNGKNKSMESELKESKVTELNKVTSDTLNSIFPVQIENDKGSVNITGIRTFKNGKLAESGFVISLVDISDFSLIRELDKSVLIDSNGTVLSKDTINSAYLNSAVIKEIEFDYVRANTLYFKTVLENPAESKEIIGRFNLFYRTKKKGNIYGWITDEVKETLNNNTSDCYSM